MELLPIHQTQEENQVLLKQEAAQEIIDMALGYYQLVGYQPPWVSYLAIENKDLVGTGGFKGKPQHGKVEIAYMVFEPFRKLGWGTAICKQLVELSLTSDPSIHITARTLPEKNPSTSILESNNFELAGTVIDPEDGEVWEWVYKK